LEMPKEKPSHTIQSGVAAPVSSLPPHFIECSCKRAAFRVARLALSAEGTMNELKLPTLPGTPGGLRTDVPMQKSKSRPNAL